MRFVVAAMSHETNTFSPIPTPLSAFCVGSEGDTPPHGKQIIEACRGTRTCIAAFLDLAAEAEAVVRVPLFAHAAPSGPVGDDAFEYICDAICTAVRDGCDAVMLDLHGAMVTESHDDGEGELLRRIRAIAPEVPMAVALDFHANMSAAMVSNATVITGYCTYPHVDMYETAERCGRTLLRTLRREVVPRVHCLRVPMLTHTLRQAPDKQPMKDITDKAIACERDGGCLNASVFGGFPMADIAHVGLSVLIKSRQHFRAGFEPIAKHVVLLSGPGVTSSDYSLFDFAKVPRPMYPLDLDMDRYVSRLHPDDDNCG